MKRSLFVLACSLGLIPMVVQAAAWPTSTTSTDLGAALIAQDVAFEPSGIVWSADRSQYLAVGDEGQVAVLSENGSVVSEWKLGSGYDLEDITVIPGVSSKAYLLDENTSSAREFDLTSGTLTGKSWSFAAYISEVNAALGAEGLAWVPDGYHAHGTTVSGGLFYVGWQNDGDVYVFEPNLSGSATPTFIEELHLSSGYTDLSGLYFSTETELFYAMYDGLNLVQEWTASGVLKTEYTGLPGVDQEGVTIIPTSATMARFVLAEDTGTIRSYEGYPIVIPVSAAPAPAPVDADSDGVTVEFDCNDADATISSTKTYYVDADFDTLGSTVAVAVCSSTAPSGYSTNANDTNDTIPNFGIEISGDNKDNDGDGAIDEVNTLASNGVHPYYRQLNPADTTAYGRTILWATGKPGGYYHVKYADNSIYRYRAITTSSQKSLSRSTLNKSAYLKLSDGTTVAVVNGYTGAILGTISAKTSSAALTAWIESLTGLDLP